MRLSIRSTVFTASLVGGILIPVLGRSATIVGNPTTAIVGVGSASLYVDAVVAKPCSAATQTITVADYVSDVVSVDLLMGQQTWCNLYVNLKWTSSGSIVQVEVDGFTTYQTLNGADDYVIQLDDLSETATLVPDTGKS